MTDSADLLPGTLDLLILKAISLGRLHGYGVLLRIQQITDGRSRCSWGALYPALCLINASPAVRALPLHVEVIVYRMDLAVHPSEAERLFNGVVVGQ